MSTRITKTTIEEYNDNGKLVKRTISEVTEEINDNLGLNPVDPIVTYKSDLGSTGNGYTIDPSSECTGILNNPFGTTEIN